VRARGLGSVGRARQTSTAAGNRPRRTARTSARWSATVWSAYATANVATASSNESFSPR